MSTSEGPNDALPSVKRNVGIAIAIAATAVVVIIVLMVFLSGNLFPDAGGVST